MDLPLALHYFVSATGAMVFLVAGAGLLVGKNWARISLVVWIGVSLVFTYLVTGSVGYLLPKLATALITVVLLFTPRVNRAVHAA